MPVLHGRLPPGKFGREVCYDLPRHYAVHMPLKIVALLITLAINIIIGVTVFFFMLLAMNGFSESDASYGLGLYVVLALVVSLAMSAGAALAVRLLIKRQFKPGVAALIAITIFSIFGAGLKIVCSIIGVSVAEYVRVSW